MSRASRERRQNGQAARANEARGNVVSDVMRTAEQNQRAFEANATGDPYARARMDGDVVVALQSRTEKGPDGRGKIVPIGRAATSYIQQRIQLATRAGLTFSGQRDLYYTLGYLRVIMWFDLAGRFQRGGIAQRLVKAPCRATWRAAPEVIENPDPAKQTKFEKDFSAFATRTNLFHYLERADVVSGIGRYGCLLLGGGGVDLSQPLKKGQPIKYLAVFSEYSARILSLETNPADPRFGLPSFYRLNLGTDLIGGAPAMQFVKVHWTRVIHLAEDRLEDEVFGIPRMLPVWNYLDDLEKVVGGSAEAFWHTADRGLQADVDKDLNLLDDDAKDLSNEIDEYMHGQRRFLRTQGVKLNVLGAQVADPSGPFKAILSLIAGTKQIPQRVLLGTEAGHLASTEDGASWKETISDRQRLYAGPCILRPLINRLVDFEIIRPPKDYDGYTEVWPDLLAISETDKAINAMRYGTAILNISQAHQFAVTTGNQPLVTDQEVRSRWLGLEANPADSATYGGRTADDVRKQAIQIQKASKAVKGSGRKGSKKDKETPDGSTKNNPNLRDPLTGDPGNDDLGVKKGKNKDLEGGVAPVAP